MKTGTLLFLLFFTSGQALPADAIRGEQIAAEMEKRTTGFKPFSVNATLVSVSKGSTETYPREMQLRVMNNAEREDGYLTFVEVTTPARIRGTAYLTLSRMRETNVQWRYDPAFFRKVAVSNPQGSFLESSFSYEDIADQEVRKFSYAYLRNEPCGTLTCYVLERTPIKKSAYSKQVVWVDVAEYRVQKAELYDKSGTVTKSVAVRGYQRVQDRFWWPSIVEVKTAGGRISRIKYGDYRVDSTITSALFNPTRMKENREAGN